MSSKSSEDGVKQFLDIIINFNLYEKLNQVVEIISGPLLIARNKLLTIDKVQQTKILPKLEDIYKSNLRMSIVDIYQEEKQSANNILEDINLKILELQIILDTISQRLLVDINKKSNKTKERQLIFICFEDCRNILLFLKLKTKILNNYLEIPPDIHAESNPFIYFPEFIADETPRVTVFENGTSVNGKLIPIGQSLEIILGKIRKSFDCPDFQYIFTASGGQINDVDLIRDDEILFASKGESFIPRKDIVVAAAGGGNVSRHSCSSIKNHSQEMTCVENSMEWVKLNVGGQLFYTSRTTLLNREPGSMLARMFDPDSNIKPSCHDSNGAFLIDRDPKYFSPILNFLRSGNLILDPGINPTGVLEEAHFFGIQSCVPALEEMLIPRDEVPLTRRDVINALILTPHKSTLRFQGVNLNGADLSYLDLRNVNFKYAKLRNSKLSYSNLSFCNFERADLTGVEMTYAILSGVRMANASMEGALCAKCNFQDPGGRSANMEGVNLRNAVLEDSDLTGANLRVSNLKHANLRATILRGAILAGADLEMCDLTGSDLHEANLRGANLKDASLELMINALHMAQAIR